MATFSASCSAGVGAQAPPPPVVRGTVTAPVTAEPVAGLKWDWDGVARYGAYLESFGGGDTFYELVWCDVEPARGQRDWSRIDDVVSGAASYGFRMHLKIRTGSCWATGGRLEERGEKRKTPSLLPTDLDAYTEFVTAVVQRYAPQGVHRYAVENEVNLPGFWRSSVADYESIVRAASPAIRAADPQATVLDSGLSSTAAGAGMAAELRDQGHEDAAVATYRRYYQRRFLARNSQMPQADDGGELDDALTGDAAQRHLDFLDATFRLAGDGVIDAYQLHFYERWDNVAPLLEFLGRHLPTGFPVESWETGLFWPGAAGDEEQLAAETARTTALLLAGGVRLVIWLPVSADTQRAGGEVRWGLFDPTGRPRMAAAAFAELTRVATSSEVTGLAHRSLSGVTFTRKEGTIVLMWSEPGARLSGSPPPGTSARQLDGTPARWGPAGLSVGSAPVIIETTDGLQAILESAR